MHAYTGINIHSFAFPFIILNRNPLYVSVYKITFHDFCTKISTQVRSFVSLFFPCLHIIIAPNSCAFHCFYIYILCVTFRFSSFVPCARYVGLQEWFRMIPHALVLDFKAILRRVAERSKVHFVRQLSSNLLRTGRKCRSVLYEDIVRAASTCKIFNNKTRFTLETLTDKKQQCEGVINY